MAYKSRNRAPVRSSGFGDVTSGAIFLVTVLLLFAVAVTLYFGTGIALSAFSSNPVFNIVTGKPELPPSIPKPSTRVDVPSGTPTVEPTPTPPPAPVYLRIANTGGDGVFLRRTPRSADKLVAWMDGTVLEVIGEDRETETGVWRHVKDPKGNIGWVPAQYVVEAAQ